MIMAAQLFNRNLLSVIFLMTVAAAIVFQAGCSNSGDGVNPGMVNLPLVYAKRTIPVDNNGDPVQYDVREPLLFNEGGDLYIRDYASASSAPKNVTYRLTNGRGDVKDIEVSYDGEKVIFSMRLEDPNPNDTVIPKWNIYEYNIPHDELTRVIASDSLAREGNDIAPYYLPDGRIVFSSDRQTQSREALSNQNSRSGPKVGFSALDERRGIKALVLHVMDSDGANIHQISFNHSHDFDPVVMPDGRILFSRWDKAGNHNLINLYTVNPDGSDLEMYYGGDTRSHTFGDGDVKQFTQPRVLQDGRILTLAMPFTDTYAGGDLLAIDATNYVNINQPVFAQNGILSGPGQVKATPTNVSFLPLSVSGRYGSAYPLLDGSNRMIVSKGNCQVTTDPTNDPNVVVRLHPCVEPYLSSPTVTEMPYAYGLWIYDLTANTERPLLAAEPGYILTDVAVAQFIKPADRPLIIPDNATGVDAGFASVGAGILDIRSVYDMGKGAGSFTCRFVYDSCTPSTISSLQDLSNLTVAADDRPARFLRIIKPVSLPQPNDTEFALNTPPDPQNTAFGRNTNHGMREIIGYTPIEPDGSVRVLVPANVAFGIEVLDKFGRRIGPRHDNWLQVRPGQTLNCVGCHEVPSGQTLPLPHGRNDAIAPSINLGALVEGDITGSQIPNTNIAYSAHIGETMAQTRTEIDPTQLKPSVNIVYEDKWTPASSPSHNASFSYLYSDTGLAPTSYPASDPCISNWDAHCRVVINYLDHIHPLWEMDRGVNTCTNCHTTNNNTQVPAGQLDLTRGVGNVSDEEPDHIESYRDLMFDDNEQSIVNNMLVDTLITRPAVDANNQPILDVNGVQLTEQVPVNVSRSMSESGARASYFMEKMTNTELNAPRTLSGSTNHAGFLTPAELKMIAEWLDLGGQYFNNPFDDQVPMNQ